MGGGSITPSIEFETIYLSTSSWAPSGAGTMKFFTSYQKIKTASYKTIEVEQINSNFGVGLTGFKEDGTSTIITIKIVAATQYNIEEYDVIQLKIAGSNQGDVTATLTNIKIS